MSRAATGTVQYRPGKDGKGGTWWGKLTLANGKRSPWIELGLWPNSPQGKARAKESCAAASERAREMKLEAAPKRDSAPPSAGEKLEDYIDRWIADREARGLSRADVDRGRLRQHLLPYLKGRPIAQIERVDLERVVERLDERVRAGEITWKTALNAWVAIRKLFDDARNAKTLSLRVLEKKPAADVRGPDRGARKSKAYLYPSEFRAFARFEEVPLEWRRLVALAVYTYTRAGELAALDWSDVDLERGVLHVHRAVDVRGKLKATKTGTARRLPIEPELLPLLKVMHEESGGRGRVVPWMPSTHNLSSSLRKQLRAAGLAREELFVEGDATRKPMTFHDLRSTGCTWMALRRDDPLKIMQRAGHSDFKTTQLYVREAENLMTLVGEPFPALPSELLKRATPGIEKAARSRIVRGIVSRRPNYAKLLCEGRDLNPHRSNPTGT